MLEGDPPSLGREADLVEEMQSIPARASERHVHRTKKRALAELPAQYPDVHEIETAKR